MKQNGCGVNNVRNSSSVLNSHETYKQFYQFSNLFNIRYICLKQAFSFQPCLLLIRAMHQL